MSIFADDLFEQMTILGISTCSAFTDGDLYDKNSLRKDCHALDHYPVQKHIADLGDV
jgi:hypothetical protein